MARFRMEGNTTVLQDAGRREVMGVVDIDGVLWLRDVPGGESLWNEGRFIGPPRQKDPQPRPRLAGGSQVCQMIHGEEVEVQRSTSGFRWFLERLGLFCPLLVLEVSATPP